jgi:hypothetical protein
VSRIYVSSTFDDLQECREKVRTAIRRMGHEDVAMEYYVAEDKRPLEKCLADVRSSDLYVGIFAWRYGFIPQGDGESITVQEYRAARAAGKECLILLLDEEAPWPRRRIEIAATDRVEALRAELQDGIVSYFTGPADIDARFIEMVHAWEKRQGLDRGPAGGWDVYRAAVVRAHESVRLTVIAGAKQDRIAKIPLAEIFTPQLAVAGLPRMDLPDEVLRYKEALFEATATDEPEEPDGGDDQAVLTGLPELSLDLLGRERTQVILGTPGSGKSTLLECAALFLSTNEDAPGDEGGKAASARLPHLEDGTLALFFDLRQYALHAEPTFFGYLSASLAERYGQVVDESALQNQFKDRPTLLLFDGLDEVFDQAARTRVVRNIIAIAEEFDRARLVVTSRIVGYDASDLTIAGFTHCTLIEFNAQQIESFVHKWYQYYTWEGDERGADALIQRIVDSPRLMELAGNPLLLTMMGVLFKHQDLPEQRWKLYERCTEVLLEDWDIKRKSLDLRTVLPLDIPIRAPQKAEILQRVSMFMLTHSDAQSELNAIAARPLMRVLAEYLGEKYAKPPGEAEAIAEGILNHLRERTYILAEIGNKIFGFVHRTFMEYFAASQCTAEFNAKRADYNWLRALFRERWDEEQWKEVLLLLIGMLADQRSPIRDIVTDLRDAPVAGPPFNLAFAALCLAEAGEVDDMDDARALADGLAAGIARYSTTSARAKDAPSFVETGVSAFGRIARLVDLPDGVIETVERLQSETSSRPRIAGWQMGLAMRPPTERLEFALTALGDDDEAVRRAAVGTVEREWPGRVDAGSALISLLGTEKRVRVRQAILDALQRSWPPSPAILDAIAVRAGTESSYTYILYVLEYLERTWRASPETVPLILELAAPRVSISGSEQMRVARAAMTSLARIWRDAPDVLSSLVDAVAAWSWGRENLIPAAAEAWGGRPGALAVFSKIAAEGTTDKRAVAIDLIAAGWNGTIEGYDVLKGRLQAERDQEVRLRITVRATGEFGFPAGIEQPFRIIFGLTVASGFPSQPLTAKAALNSDVLLELAAQDSDPSVRWAAAFLRSGEAGDALGALLESAASEQDSRARAMTALVLADRPPTGVDVDASGAYDARRLLATSIEHPSAQVRATALRALVLAETRMEELAKRLDDAARDPEALLRAVVAGCPTGTTDVDDATQRALLQDDPDALVRATAVVAFMARYDYESVAESAVRDSDPWVRAQLVATLSGVMPSQAPSPLRNRLATAMAEAVAAVVASEASWYVWNVTSFDLDPITMRYIFGSEIRDISSERRWVITLLRSLEHDSDGSVRDLVAIALHRVTMAAQTFGPQPDWDQLTAEGSS